MKDVEIVKITEKNQEKFFSNTGVRVDVRRGPAYYGLVDDKIIFVCGHTVPWPGMAEAWLLPFDGFENYLDAPRKIGRLNDVLSVMNGLHRLQACIDATIPKNIRFMEYLGFKKEATLANYGPQGQDFVMMRRT